MQKMRVFMLCPSFLMQIYESAAVQDRRIESDFAVSTDKFRADKAGEGTQDEFCLCDAVPGNAPAVQPDRTGIEDDL